jgi:DNA-binding beta-propeller fold protein YncE
MAAQIETIGGTGQPADNGNDGPALRINIGDPFGVELGKDDALYVTEVRNHRVFRLSLEEGTIRTVVGNGQRGYSGDGGSATDARLNEPYEVRFDTSGNMYFVEMQNHVIRRVSADGGRITTIAGTGKPGFGGDGGLAIRATFNTPHSIALDAVGNLYVADIGNHRIRRIDATTGIVETVAGSSQRELPVDGQEAKGNPIMGPRALYITGMSLWIALREGHSVWRLDLQDGILHHVAGTGSRGYSGDGGPAKEATFDGPKGIAVSPGGDVYVVDTENHAVRRIDIDTLTITTVAGGKPDRSRLVNDDNEIARSQLSRPHGICVGHDGAVYVADTLNHRVLRIRPSSER